MNFFDELRRPGGQVTRHYPSFNKCSANVHAKRLPLRLRSSRVLVVWQSHALPENDQSRVGGEEPSATVGRGRREAGVELCLCRVAD
jgi:hypothetical protein